VAPAKTIYVKDSDVPTWERFETAVKEWQAADSVSALISEAMRQYLAQFGDQGDGLYVEAPDEDPGDATLDKGVFVLGGSKGGEWKLWYDEDAFGPDTYGSPYEIGHGTVAQAVEAARKHMAYVRQNKDFKRIEVECENTRTGMISIEAFTGRWLVEPDSDETRTNEDGYDAGVYWGVALTRRGRIAVYAAHCNSGGGQLEDYDDLDEAEGAGHPKDIITIARAELTGSTPVFERDI
jgi:hypothetical protein